MAKKKKILGGSLLVILVTFVVVLLVFTLQSFAQEMTYPTSGGIKTELTSGQWVLSGVESYSHNSLNITKWNTAVNELQGECSWMDEYTIIHTISSGFKWEEPPRTMPIGAFMNIEAKYINNEYSTPCRILTGIKMYLDRSATNYISATQDAVEIMKVLKDNKFNNSEVKKGFFTAPKTLFDETYNCDLVIDCYVGDDHYVTKYRYTYQP